MRSSGPIPAEIMIVGDFPDNYEERAGEPLVGPAGHLLNGVLSSVGFLRNSCFVALVCRKRPPKDDIDEWVSDRKTSPDPSWTQFQGKWVHPNVIEGVNALRREIEEVKPKLIIALGNLSLWALTGYSGISKWRGSRLSPPGIECTVVPSLHPSAALRQTELKSVIQMDLKRAKNIYEGTQNPRHYQFLIEPTFDEAVEALDYLQGRADYLAATFGGPLRLAGDLETRRGNIACFGIAWSETEAVCIPFLHEGNPELGPVSPFYWADPEREAIVTEKILRLFSHPNIVWDGQNYLYDCQYFYRFWGMLPRWVFDTMIGHHSIYSNMRKGLDFLSSMYAQDHVYWKDESKDWDPHLGEKQLWTYNCLTIDTPVLMANCQYKALGDIQIGEKILAFEEEGSDKRYARRLREATVTKTAKAFKRVKRYRFSDGSILDATDDHKIITSTGLDSRSEFRWKEMRELKLGDRIVSLGPAWEKQKDFQSGWLSGIFDGEGTVGISRTDGKCYPRLGFSQKPGKVLDLAVNTLQAHGFWIRESPKSSATYVDINGGLQEQLRFLGTFGPIRLISDFLGYARTEGLSGFGRVPRPVLVSIAELGEKEVADITTTEGTFIANGVVVHNCKDCCITWEISPEIKQEQAESAVAVHCEFQQRLFFPVLRMMNRGVKLDVSYRDVLRISLMEAQLDRQEKLNYMAGHDLNPRSPAQLVKFFYHDLGLPVIRALQSESITTNSPAMSEIANREPALKKLCQTIVELRSIGVFLGTFINAELDSDARMRCSFAIAGPTTFRFSSSENAFGSGMNLQNIPVAEKEKIKSADYIKLPNVRRLFIPDPGYTFFDMDLDRADMQIVAWESGDKNLKDALRRGIDIHCMNACEAFDIKGIPYDELAESHPNYKEHRERIGKKNRDKVKNGGHACDYGVGERKLAQTLGITVAEASRFRAKWFAIHPGILAWHKRTQELVLRLGYSENKFGARLYNLGTFDLPEHLGWLPQSTVAGVINRALVAIDEAEQKGETSIQLLIQVHDSLAGQFLTSRKDAELANLRRLAQIVVPYPEPLIIPVGIKTSTKSWGECA